MAFLKRLGWYLVGLAIGICFLYFFLQKKSRETGTEFCYFPNCRVLRNITSKPLSFSDEIQQKLATKEIDSTTLLLILKNGKVDFGRSNTDSGTCKTYIIEDESREQEISVKNCPEGAQVESIKM